MSFQDLEGRSFDYVIVGGGSAGSVLAGRLSEVPGSRVLLVEAGVDTPPGAVPAEILQTEQIGAPLALGDRFIWPGFEVDFATAGTPPFPRRDLYEQGRVLGGGSSVNVMAANRGLPRDYDEWQSLGAEGWGWADILPYFNKLERDLEFDGPLHGKTGPIPISRAHANSWPPFIAGATRALRSLGLQDIGDQNARFENGYFRPGQSNENGQRVSAAIGYLGADVRQRRNLVILTETFVEKIVLSGKRATGVRLVRDGQTREIAVGREVILTAGALQTPALLLRAGIGPAADLRRHGIEVLADRPGVGSNLLDHTATFLFSAIPPESGLSPEPGSAHHLAARISSGVDPEIPSDLYLVIGAGHPGPGLGSFGLWINKPSSKGRVTLANADPRSYPQVDFQLLSDSRDVERIRAGYRFIADLTQRDGLAEYGLSPLGVPSRMRFAHRGSDAPEALALAALLQDDAALDGFLRRSVKGLWHASGTARIGAATDPDAVVDAAGRVYGVSGLRVADASVFPSIPTANINLPVIATAEKIAAAIVAG